MSIILSDLITDTSEIAVNGYKQALDEISNEDFKLKKNYLLINLDEFVSFNIVTYKGEFVAMAGLQKSFVGSDFVRASTKLYISKKYRNLNFSKNRLLQNDLPEELYFPNSKIIFPYQANVARQQNFKALYITREEPFQLRMIQAVLKSHNEMQAKNDKLYLLPRIYNIANPPIEKKSCYQRFMVLLLDKNFSFEDFENALTVISDEDLMAMPEDL